MVDTAKLRKGDIVRGLLSRKRYRVICVDGCHVYAVHACLRRYSPCKAFWLNVQCLEEVK